MRAAMKPRRRVLGVGVLLCAAAGGVLAPAGCAGTDRDRYYQAKSFVYGSEPGDPRITLTAPIDRPSELARRHRPSAAEKSSVATVPGTD